MNLEVYELVKKYKDPHEALGLKKQNRRENSMLDV
jgi:hypothetical protein